MYIPLPILITELNSEYFSFADWYTADFALSVEGAGSTWKDAELLFFTFSVLFSPSCYVV